MQRARNNGLNGWNGFSTTDYKETLIFLKDTGLNGWNGLFTTDCTDDTGYNRINMQEISSNLNTILFILMIISKLDRIRLPLNAKLKDIADIL